VLAQSNRLRRRTDFVRVTRTGRRSTRGCLVAYLEPTAEPVGAGAAVGAPPKVGFVVGKTVGGAVARNAVTRRLRALARDRLVRLPAGSSLVVRALPAAATADIERLGTDLDACLDRLLTPVVVAP
jgi:ribonuclease P protein component